MEYVAPRSIGISCGGGGLPPSHCVCQRVEGEPSNACSATPFSPTVSSLSTYHSRQFACGITPPPPPPSTVITRVAGGGAGRPHASVTVKGTGYVPGLVNCFAPGSSAAE